MPLSGGETGRDERDQSLHLNVNWRIILQCNFPLHVFYRCADKYLTQPGKKQARKYVREARHFNNIETRAVIKIPPPLQRKAPKEIHAILTETLVCFLPVGLRTYQHPLYNSASVLICISMKPKLL